MRTSIKSEGANSPAISIELNEKVPLGQKPESERRIRENGLLTG
ncbi:hypothetical protein CODIS_39940 [Candidatus Thiodiazotropha endolucinida]|uniref:Uncharacterized protein n=1 Tax=Candidatus Thiodiazotropha endolucinida TaxID=1655433 RepID=A0A7Z0VHR4_9GAMM|nr:hypothetical protein CODIS_39940 [Candidatus Thiodiazotropha endolucinida]